jgi:hypothetical protein
MQNEKNSLSDIALSLIYDFAFPEESLNYPYLPSAVHFCT